MKQQQNIMTKIFCYLFIICAIVSIDRGALNGSCLTVKLIDPPQRTKKSGSVAADKFCLNSHKNDVTHRLANQTKMGRADKKYFLIGQLPICAVFVFELKKKTQSNLFIFYFQNPHTPLVYK